MTAVKVVKGGVAACRNWEPLLFTTASVPGLPGMQGWPYRYDVSTNMRIIKTAHEIVCDRLSFPEGICIVIFISGVSMSIYRHA